jgi:hypothetical protein
MNNLAPLLEFMKGKRTYAVAFIAVGYLIACQFTKQKPEETILGILGSLGLASLRAGMSSESKSQ